MNRDYENGKADNVRFFSGFEVEKTPAHLKLTLFVTGINDAQIIRGHLDTHKHIFFGANHSFDPATENHSADYYEEWEKMIQPFLQEGYLCSLDIPINAAEMFLDGPLIEYENFIPQLRVPIPYIKQWNYNTMIKIDDKDFQATNPGVWCHRLHTLMDEERFTNWEEYKNDKIVDDN